MCNQNLKLMAAGKGVKLWEIALEMGMTDSSLSRKMRVELPEQERKRFIDALNAIVNRRTVTETT